MSRPPRTSPELARVLPRQARAWIERAAGPGSQVLGAAAMPGATSSAVHAITLFDARGHRRELVLRRYVLADWLEQEPDLAEREAEVLGLLEASPVVTPTLVGVDPTGAVAGAPSVLMTRLPGRPVPSADLDEVQVHALAGLLPLLHATAVPVSADVRAYRPYYAGQTIEPPPWSDRPEMWARAIEIHHAAVPHPSDSTVLVHRDYHPGNVLFDGANLTGIVDWAVASLGPAGVDVGHCRVNLALLGSADLADRFLDAWLVASGCDSYDPTFDLLAAVGGLPETPSFLDHDHHAVDDLVARAVAALGP